jgi:hypothetical protein
MSLDTAVRSRTLNLMHSIQTPYQLEQQSDETDAKNYTIIYILQAYFAYLTYSAYCADSQE